MFHLHFLQNVAKSAAVSSRYTDSSLRGVIQVEGLFSPGLFIDFFSPGYSHAEYIRLPGLHIQFSGSTIFQFVSFLGSRTLFVLPLEFVILYQLSTNFITQVCRIAYELMQQHHVDASDRFKSLDDIWWVLDSNHSNCSFSNE